MQEYFETIKCDDYEIFNLDYHCKRIANTIALNINLSEYIYPPSNKLLKCKVIYDESGILDVQYDEYKKRQIKSFKIIYDDNISYSKKTVNRDELNKLFNQRQNSDEIIIIKNNIVTDTSIANIAILYEGTWITSKSYLLKGTTRSRYLNETQIIEKDITLEMLKKAEKIALMNAMIDFDEISDYSLSL
ncbi:MULTISPECIES: aminotransferase class IV [Arcobacteraceae]|uniref:Branched-chain amino acid aminotransferase n=1 Tax=Poseidonibacter parvus TaxID=1850254 RepID=A0A1P8KPP6_9BACT|nr:MULTISPECIES: aminotransferase class IV [Arcobacteraceae]APW66582.1 branched-chain amino acid aminotransferase [Poseidonibacter parvus]